MAFFMEGVRAGPLCRFGPPVFFSFSFFYRSLAQGLGHDPVRFSAAVSYNEKAEHPPLFSKKGIILRTFYL